MHDLVTTARAAGVPQAELIALAPANDPFATHQPARRRNAGWFAEIFAPFGFGSGARVRRIHYRIVSQEEPILRPDGKPYTNTTSPWAMLVNASRDARYLGLVRDPFVDRRNPDPMTFFEPAREGRTDIDDRGLVLAEPHPDFPDSPEFSFAGVKYGQPVLIEIWVEKTTMNDELEPLARRYGVNVIPGAGEKSEIAVRLLMERVGAAGVMASLIYISDHDPAGRSMPVAVARKIEFALFNEDQPLDITLDPIVLTEDQCREYRLRALYGRLGGAQ